MGGSARRLGSPFVGGPRHAVRGIGGPSAVALLALSLIAVLTVFPVAPASAVGTTYYVNASTGNDANDCLSSGNACVTIQAAIDKAQAGDTVNTVNVAAGTYLESVTISEELTLIGAGSATTIIDPPSGVGLLVTAGGSSGSSRLVVQGIGVTGATDGISVSGANPLSHLTFTDVRATGNTSNGLHFGGTAAVADVVVSNGVFSSNAGTGIRIATAVPSFDGLSVNGATVSGNGYSGFGYNPSGTITNVGTNFTFENSTFSGNATSGAANIHELSFWGFHGNATLRDVTVTPAGAAYGILFSNRSSRVPTGTVLLDGVTVAGTMTKGALSFQIYSDTAGVTLVDVSLSGATAPWGQFILDSTDPDPFALGNTVLKSAVVWSSGGVDATSAEFRDLTTDAPLDRLVLADGFTVAGQTGDAIDAEGLGLIRWKPGQVFVTPTSSLQRGVNAATAGDIVRVAAGKFTGNLIVPKSLTLSGAKAGVPAGPMPAPDGRDVTAPYDDGPEESWMYAATGTALTIADGVAGVTIDGFVIETFDATLPSIDLGQNAQSDIVRNSILTGRTRSRIKDSLYSAGIMKRVSNVGSTYAFEFNRIEGGSYGITLNSQAVNDVVSIRGNYITLVQRGVLSQQTESNGVGTMLIRDNAFEGVERGVRMAQGGHFITGNTFTNLAPAPGNTQSATAAIQMDGSNGSGALGGLSVWNNDFSAANAQYGVLLNAGRTGQPYVFRQNAFSSSGTTWAVYVSSPGAGTAVDATANWWGQDTGPTGSQVSDGGASVDTTSYITSYTVGPFTPGFWPLPAPAVTTTVTVPSTTNAPPVVAQFDDPASTEAVSVMVDFGAVTGGSVTVTTSDTPSDGSVSFGGNPVIEISLDGGTFTPPVEICLSYTDADFPPGTTPALFHYVTGPPAGWEQLETSRIDLASKVVCGLAFSLSPFGVGVTVAQTPVITYTGTTYTMDGTATLSATLDLVGCPGTIDFDLTPVPSGGDPGPVTIVGGVATFDLTDLAAGVYEIVVTYTSSDDDCDDTGVQDTAVLVAVTAGGAANGGGWYKDPDVTPPRANFGFVIQRTYSGGRTKTPTGFRGQFLFVNNEAWRLKATLSGSDIYGTFTCPGGVGATGSGPVCASFRGSGMLQSWDADLYGLGLGGWVDEEEVSFTVTVYDGGQIKVCKGKRNCTRVDVADWFGIEIDGWPSDLVPEGTPMPLVQPDGKGSIRASA